MKNEIVAHNDLKIRIEDNFFNPTDSNQLLEKLIARLPWESMVIKMFGKDTMIPRLQCWVGDKGCDYKYSGKKLNRQDWTKDLKIIREKHQINEDKIIGIKVFKSFKNLDKKKRSNKSINE